MKTGKVIIEIITIYCPECDAPFLIPGIKGYEVSDCQPGEYDMLSNILECQDCGYKFRKPTITFDRISKRDRNFSL